MQTAFKIIGGLVLMGLVFIGVRMRNIEWAARIAWGEARGEDFIGMQAVINVMQNRVKDRRFPNSLAAVATQDKQFSAFNENDPNRPKLEAVTEDDRLFASAVELAARAVRDDLLDVTRGATHYHSRFINPPFWTAGATETARIGNHIFYRDVA